MPTAGHKLADCGAQAVHPAANPRVIVGRRLHGHARDDAAHRHPALGREPGVAVDNCLNPESDGHRLVAGVVSRCRRPQISSVSTRASNLSVRPTLQVARRVPERFLGWASTVLLLPLPTSALTAVTAAFSASPRRRRPRPSMTRRSGRRPAPTMPPAPGRARSSAGPPAQRPSSAPAAGVRNSQRRRPDRLRTSQAKTLVVRPRGPRLAPYEDENAEVAEGAGSGRVQPSIEGSWSTLAFAAQRRDTPRCGPASGRRQRRPSIVVGLVHVGVRSEQLPDDLGVAVVRTRTAASCPCSGLLHVGARRAAAWRSRRARSRRRVGRHGDEAPRRSQRVSPDHKHAGAGSGVTQERSAACRPSRCQLRQRVSVLMPRAAR